MHEQKTIGVVPNAPKYGQSEDRYADFYRFCDTYIARVAEAGLLPLGVLPLDGFIRTDILSRCDAFLIQGGDEPRPYHIDVIDHAVKTGKKVLGICLGCQCLQCYFATASEAKKRGFTGKLSDLFVTLESEGYPFLQRVDGHRPSAILPRENLDAIKHPVLLTKGSLTARVFGTTKLMGASVHLYCIGEPAQGLVVSGRAEDGTVEAVEYGETVIGTQFHPDVDRAFPQLFAWLGD